MSTLGPKISIVVPIYNVENFVGKCLDSLIHQTLKDIEIICVDDGTKDKSCDVVEAFAKIDDRVKLYHKENGGLSSARNYGIKRATGRYIWCVDSDDYVETYACEVLYNAIQSYDTDIITFGANCVPEYPQPDEWTINNLSPISGFFDFTKENPVVRDPKNNSMSVLTKHELKSPLDVLTDVFGTYPFVWRSCFKRQFLVDNGFEYDESVKFGEDTIYYFDIYPKAKKILLLSNKLYNYRHYRKGSLMYGVQKMDVKIYQHLIITDYVLSHAGNKGYLAEFGADYLKWAVGFNGFEISTYIGPEKEKFVVEFMRLLENNNLIQYSRKLKDEKARYYSKIKQYYDKKEK